MVSKPASSLVPFKLFIRCGSLLKLCHLGYGAGIKWALLRQPSASLVHIVVLGKEPGSANCIIRGWPSKHTWEGPVQEEQEDTDEELKGLMEVSEDNQGFRALVCTHIAALVTH